MTNTKKGLVDKNYFLNRVLNKNINLYEFEIENVIGDGNCGY